MYEDVKTLKVKQNLEDYLKKLRSTAERENRAKRCNLDKTIFVEPRKGFLDGHYVDRLVLFLRGTGCMQAKETGGCTFCGFYNATNFGKKILDEDYIKQIACVVQDKAIQFSKYATICLYNDGSLLREDEISFSVVLEIFRKLNDIDTVKKIVIESRIDDIAEEKLKKIREVTQKDIEIAVGFESASPMIRDLCVHKSFSNKTFSKVLEVSKKYSISIIPLLILKPPFLTESESIEDYMNSLKFLEQFDIKRIDMELASVEKNTLVYDMWCNGMYQPPKLWTVIEILKRKEQLGLTIPIYISPANYSVSAVAKSSNCDDCTDYITQLFEEYNVYGKKSVFDNVHCHCRDEWLKLLQAPKRMESLPDQVENVLKRLEEIQIEKRGK